MKHELMPPEKVRQTPSNVLSIIQSWLGQLLAKLFCISDAEDAADYSLDGLVGSKDRLITLIIKVTEILMKLDKHQSAKKSGAEGREVDPYQKEIIDAYHKQQQAHEHKA